MKKKITIKCHRCGGLIEDAGLAMLFWATHPPSNRIVAWCVAHKSIEYRYSRCDPEKDWNARGWFDWSAELSWFLNPDWPQRGFETNLLGPPNRRIQVYRVLIGYDWPAADALALCALFQVPPPAEFAATGRTG
jgi:hypothetical protein